MVVPGLLLLVAREILDHDPPRVLAWRLLHEPHLLERAPWLAAAAPAAPVLDRDPVALVLTAGAVLVAFLYLAAAMTGASARLRAILLGAGAAFLVALPTLAFVAMSAATGRPYGQDGGVVQLPLAIDKILAGESPYGADYSGTVLARQARASAFWEPLGGNPILRHHAYLPGTHLVMLPAHLFSRATLGFFDPRLVTLAFYALAAALAFRLPEREDARLAAAGVCLFNPLTWWQQVFGANDVVFVALLLAVALLARGGRAVAAAALLGLACATKQLAWPFAPFLLATLSGAGSLRALVSGPALARLGLPVAVCLASFAAVVGPVAALDPAAFFADIVKYNVGLPGDNYPLGGTPGFGFANVLIGYGAVTSLQEYFPFGRFYLLFVPLGLWLLARQLRLGRPEAALVMGSAALLASVYFSRVAHPNYLVAVALLLPVGALALRLPGDLALTPLALLAFAVTASEQEVFRSVWDQAVAARVPEVLPALVRAVLPQPAPGLTADPLGLVLSAAAAGLALVTLVAGLSGARSRVRMTLGLAAVAATVLVPAWFLAVVGARTGTVRGLDRFAVQLPADATRLARGESPYGLPSADRPRAREAWSRSFRLDPPAEWTPDRPLVPPGGAALGALLRLFGPQDARAPLLVALALVLTAAAARAPAAAPGLVLLLPLALGLVFGASALLPAGGLAAAVALRWWRCPRASAIAFGVTAAIDLHALVGAPLLALAGDPAPGRGEPGEGTHLAWAAGAFGLLVMPVTLLDPAAFLAALVRPWEAGAGLGLLNVLSYGTAPPAGAATVLGLASVGVALLGLAALRWGRADPWGSAILLSLVALWVDPGPDAGALALPVALLGLWAASISRGD